MVSIEYSRDRVDLRSGRLADFLLREYPLNPFVKQFKYHGQQQPATIDCEYINLSRKTLSNEILGQTFQML
jgi:hypothetical protein